MERGSSFLTQAIRQLYTCRPSITSPRLLMGTMPASTKGRCYISIAPNISLSADKMENQIDPKLRRKMIKDKVLAYSKDHPVEYMETIAKAKAIRNLSSTKFAKFKKTVFLERHVLEIPEQLFHEIRYVFDDFLQDKKELAWFTKTFIELNVTASY